MPNYVSKDGIWHPSKERVALKNNSATVIKNPSEEGSKYHNENIQPGDDYIYEGPDRASLFELFKQKVETLGNDFRHDPDLIYRVKNLGYKNVDDYAKLMGYDKVKVEADFNRKASIVQKHDLPQKVEAIRQLGGGQDTSGQGADKYGDFGLPKDLE